MERAIVQAIRRRSLFQKTRIQPHANTCAICGRQGCRGTGVFANTLAVSCHYHSNIVLCSLIFSAVRQTN